MSDPEAIDLVREVDRGLRFSLPFREERSSRKVETILPWYTVDSPDREWCLTLEDVLLEVAAAMINDPTRLGDPMDPIGGHFFTPREKLDIDRLTDSEALPWLSSWLPVVKAIVDHDNSKHYSKVERYTTITGEVPSQTAL